MNNSDTKPTLEELVSKLDPGVQDVFRSLITNVAMELSALGKEVQEIKSKMNQDGFVPFVPMIDKNKWTLGSKIENVDTFNPKHYPIGSAVLISSENSTHVCVIIGYANLDRVMKLIDAETYDRDCHIEITPDRVFGDNAEYHITRLLPDPPELEDMDYESAVKEVTEHDSESVEGNS